MTALPRINPDVTRTEAPPIEEAHAWVDGLAPDPARPLIDLAQAAPGYAPAPALLAHLRERLAADAMAGYTAVSGMWPLREALARETSSLYGGAVSGRDVMITAGCNQAFVLAVMALAGSGDAVMLPAPWYFNHRMTLEMLGIRTCPLPARAADGMVPDPERAGALLDEGVRAIVLVTPNNPTGAVYPPPVLARFLELCRERGIALIVDETYRDFLPMEQASPHELFADPAWRETLIHLYSFSKVYAMPGYRAGALIADPAFIAQAEKIMDCVAISTPTIGQHAALFGIEHLQDWRLENRRLMAARVDAFRDAMRGRNTGYELLSIGAYFAWISHPFRGESSTSVARRLATEQRLLCLPGSAFGDEDEGTLRFAFANVDASVMPEIARRLAAG